MTNLMDCCYLDCEMSQFLLSVPGPTSSAASDPPCKRQKVDAGPAAAEALPPPSTGQPAMFAGGASCPLRCKIVVMRALLSVFEVLVILVLVVLLLLLFLVLFQKTPHPCCLVMLVLVQMCTNQC